MAFLSIVMAYMLRVSLSYAITQMVTQPHASSNGTIITSPDICPPFDDELSIDEFKQSVSVNSISAIERFDWSQSLQGLILSSFYWGYIVTHIPGGLLSQKIGGKNTLLIGVLIATICTLVTPLAIESGKYRAHRAIKPYYDFVKFLMKKKKKKRLQVAQQL